MSSKEGLNTGGTFHQLQIFNQISLILGQERKQWSFDSTSDPQKRQEDDSKCRRPRRDKFSLVGRRSKVHLYTKVQGPFG